MKKILAALFITLTSIASPTAAFADRDNDYECEDCEDNRGLHFKDSPVQDSFNLIICLPDSTCNFNQPQE